MKEFYSQNKLRVDRAIYVVVFVIGVYVFFKFLMPYIFPFVFGYLIAGALHPLTAYITRKARLDRFKVGRGIISFLLIIAMLAALIFLGGFALNRGFRELQTLVDNLPDISAQTAKFAQSVKGIGKNVIEIVPEEFRAGLNDISATMFVSFTDFLGKFLSDRAGGAISRIPNGVLNFILTLLSAFFFLKDREKIYTAVRKTSGAWAARHFSIIRGGFIAALSGYFRAQLVLMSLIWAITALGLSLLKHPYAIVVAAIAAFLDALPILGIGAVFWPWIAFEFLAGHGFYAAGLAIVYVCAFLTRHLLEPKIVSTQIGLHPLLTLFSLYMGLRLFGIAGLLIGPMTAISLNMALSTADTEKT